MNSIARLTPADVRHRVLVGDEIAILDARPEREYASGHPLFAANLPPAAVEIESPWRLPAPAAQIVVFDDGEGLAEDAAQTLRRLGYERVAVLAGGLSAWSAAGLEVFTDVNSPSKAFGELVEARRHTPSLPAPEVAALIERGADLVILDARRFDEYAAMSIPGAVSAPGAELVLRARGMASGPGTLVVVNCAGRTRSLIGAQSLINAGLPNPVAALRNGTMGWRLAGLEPEHGQDRRAGEPSRIDAAWARDHARKVAYRAGVKRLDLSALDALAADTSRTLYRYDVRLPEETGSLPGFLNAQGGQLVQETDHYAPVRGARIVLADPAGSRADMTASWLAQMGWEVFVVDAPPAAFRAERPRAPAFAAIAPVDAYDRPYVGTDNPRAAMQAYLEWEAGLVEQLARDGTHGFYVV